MKKQIFFILFILLLLLNFGCTGAQHQETLHSANERKITLGLVQKEIKKGTSQADVATVLGAPNIVAQDGQGQETWIYDKISTETSYSSSSVGIGGGAGGVSTVSPVGGIIGGSAKSSSGARSLSQKTLTVIIKFDDDSLVSSIAYHTSSF
ncbi:MAG: hypothetical protein K8R67_16610 [Desulfobacteraceae bacterium]|nr:hypothetical protein [Desulfobacteraceae bacterium]